MSAPQRPRTHFPTGPPPRDERGLRRRDLLRLGALAGAGLLAEGGAWPAVAAAVAEAPRIRRRVTLGRTGLVVSDIGFGTSALRGDERLVHHALDRGITHFDTAEGYTGGEAERTLGRALRGRRNDVTITSKVVAAADDPAPKLMRELEESLRRLQTDRIDVYMNHAVNDVARLENPGWREFTRRAKQQGKIRFVGMSGHGPRLAACLDHALASDQVDAILVAYNFSQDPGFLERLQDGALGLAPGIDAIAPQPQLPALLRRAHAQRVGVMVMKTLKGARLNDMRPYETGGATFAQAAFRWVLASPDVDALVVTMRSPEQVDEYVAASGSEGRARADFPLLARYEARNGRSQCQPGCGACAASCPDGVPISDALRSRMYAVDYGDAGQALGEYARLG
ncbi:MAG TPA: aldo/keto reductase, partial [Myxococcota bacterium]|nr:aldo/keto reductase [Myxococcota bacterium]